MSCIAYKLLKMWCIYKLEVLYILLNLNKVSEIENNYSLTQNTCLCYHYINFFQCKSHIWDRGANYDWVCKTNKNLQNYSSE